MREPTPHLRVIAPHSLIRAGRRWHLRAFSSTNQDFRDYALGRVEKVERLDSPAERTEKDDQAWMTKVPVRLVAHPDLTPEQEALIRFEYFNNTAARVDTCRGALVSYFIQDVRAAVDPAKQRPPDFQMAVANIEEVRPWLFPS
jgi:predicted DNA-binding transcriptional regulator YafY